MELLDEEVKKKSWTRFSFRMSLLAVTLKTYQEVQNVSRRRDYISFCKSTNQQTPYIRTSTGISVCSLMLPE
jgi:ligand-binding sensor protein